MLHWLMPIMQALAFSHPGSYDYVPAILWNPDAAVWHAYVCGKHGGGDGIYLSTSPDRIVWSTPQLVLTSSPGAWDGQHVCDPSVLYQPRGEWGRAGWAWVMYYNGAVGDTYNRVGVALSHNGREWVKFSANPILSPSTTVGYGLGQLSVVQDGDLFRSTYVVSTPEASATRRMLSWDGWHFFDDQDWSIQPGWAPSLDILADPQGRYRYLGVFTKDWQEWLIGALDWGQPWEVVAIAPMRGTQGSGFYRDGHGFRPEGPLWSAFGTPPHPYNPFFFEGQELMAVEWQP